MRLHDILSEDVVHRSTRQAEARTMSMRGWIRLTEAFWQGISSDPSGLSAMPLQEALKELEHPAPSAAASLLAKSNARYKDALFSLREAEQAQNDWLESHPLASIVHAEVPFTNYPMSQGNSLGTFLEWSAKMRDRSVEKKWLAAKGNASWTSSFVHPELGASYIEFLGRNINLTGEIERAADEYAAQTLAYAKLKNHIQETFAASHRDLDSALDAEAQGCTLMWLGHMLWYALDQLAIQDDPEYQHGQMDRMEAGYAPDPHMTPEDIQQFIQQAILDTGEIGKQYADEFIAKHKDRIGDGKSVVDICNTLFRQVFNNIEPWWIRGFAKMMEIHGPDITLGSLAKAERR